MEDNTKLILKQLACDIKNLSELNYAIFFNKSYSKLIGQSELKKLEKAEVYYDKLLGIIENKFLILNKGDIVDLYKDKNKNETISDILKRLEK